MNILKYSYGIIILFLIISLSYIILFNNKTTVPDYSKLIDYVIDFTSDTEILTLNHGNKVLLYANQNSNTFSISIALNVGSFINKKGKEGTLYLLSKLILSSPLVYEYIENYSMSVIMNVKLGYVNIQITSPNYYIKEVYDLLDNILLKQKFSEQDLINAKRQVIEEINQYPKDARTLFQDEVLHNIFPNSMKYRSIKGNSRSIANIDLLDIRELYNNYFNSNDFITSISGNVQRETIKFFMNKMLDNLLEKNLTDTNNIDIISNSVTIPYKKHINISIKENNRGLIYLILPYVGSNTELTYAKIISNYLSTLTKSYLHNKADSLMEDITSIDVNLYEDKFTRFWTIIIEAPFTKIAKVQKQTIDILKHYKFDYKGIVEARNRIIRDNLEHFTSNNSIAKYLTSLQITSNNLKEYSWNYDKYYMLDQEELLNIWNVNFNNVNYLMVTITD